MNRFTIVMIILGVVIALGSCDYFETLFGERTPTIYDAWKIDTMEPEFPNYVYLKFTSEGQIKRHPERCGYGRHL